MMIIKTLSIFILFIICGIEATPTATTATTPVVKSFDVYYKCGVIDKSMETCGRRVCASITLKCLTHKTWKGWILGEWSLIKTTMYFDEVSWVNVGEVIDCTVYELSDGKVKISNGIFAYVDGEPIQLGPNYKIDSSELPSAPVVLVLLGGSVGGIMYVMACIFSPQKSSEKKSTPHDHGSPINNTITAPPPTSPRTYTGSGLTDRGGHKRVVDDSDSIPGIEFDIDTAKNNV